MSSAAKQALVPKRQRSRSSLLARGEPSVWLTGGALTAAVVMICGLLIFIVIQGGSTFWPRPLVEVRTHSGKVLLGEVTGEERYRPEDTKFNDLPPEAATKARAAVAEAEGWATRRKLRTGNKEDSGVSFRDVSDFEIATESVPEWGLIFERRGSDIDGNAYGVPVAFRIDGKVVSTDPPAIWELFEKYHPEVAERVNQIDAMKRDEGGALNRELNEARLALRKAELRHGIDSRQFVKALDELQRERERVARVQEKLKTREKELALENDRYKLEVRTTEQPAKTIALASIVRAYPANRLSTGEKYGVYFSRWKEFLTDGPRNANQEGGVLPAIFGTVAMTLIMSVLVVPFGVLAALYLREYAKAGPIVSAVRIAVNNLAGVPSIVFGVFGLGFFCYIIGAGIDRTFFAHVPGPTYGKGGLFWAALTLALLTLPVVIVSTEEALASVPNSIREGSYACGASKWQTIRRIVLPRAMPGIMTGMILAMARGAGEVAPLMLVGAVKYAPELPIDGVFPYVHPERSFMHLGFHIFDVGFQSRDPEAGKPMVFTTTLLLIAIVFLLNVMAVWLRARLRRRFKGSQF